MKHIALLILFFCFSILACNCSYFTINKDLDKIAGQMNENPQLSLEQLDQMNKNRIIGKRDNALYALLYTQARDKNWIDDTDDSLILVAVNYFENTNDNFNKFLSYYYWGRIVYNSENLPKALVAYTKAENIVACVDDDYAKGLLYANLGLLYQQMKDYPKSIEAFTNAYNYYIAGNKRSHAEYAKLNLGNVLLSNKQFDKAEEYLKGAIVWAYDNGEYNTLQDGYAFLLDLYIQTGNGQGLDQLLTSKYVDVIGETSDILQNIAYVSALKGKYAESEKYMQKAWMHANNSRDSSLLYYREYRIDKISGTYESALNKLEKFLSIKDSTIRKELQRPTITAQKDYYKSIANYNKFRLERNKEKLIIISIACGVILVLLVFLYLFKINAAQKEIDRYMEKICDMEESLLSASKDSCNKNNELMQMREQVLSLFASQYRFLDKLSTTYYETHSSLKDKDAIYKEVIREIDKLSKERKYIAQLEVIVNKHLDNIMQKTRKAMPHLPEMDMRLLLFMYAGFSAKAISVFTNNSTGNIYMKKSRLKENIQKSSSEYKESILYYLG